MTSFITASQRKTLGGTCYFEFQRGSFRGKHWLDCSLYLHADTFDQLRLYEVFSEALPHFDYYGVTEVRPEQYADLRSLAMNRGGRTAGLIEELDRWAADCFRTEEVFTILGI